MKLKRSHGASKDTIARIEDEAFGSGGRKQPSRVTAIPKQPMESDAPTVTESVEVEVKTEADAPLEEPVIEPEATQEPAQEVSSEPEVSQVPAQEVVSEPDLVEDREQHTDIIGDEPESDESDDNQAAVSDDLLEETPEFLEETPEGERLWFEQRPPKDFDFND